MRAPRALPSGRLDAQICVLISARALTVTKWRRAFGAEYVVCASDGIAVDAATARISTITL